MNEYIAQSELFWQIPFTSNPRSMSIGNAVGTVRLAEYHCATYTVRPSRSMGETIVSPTVPACPAGALPKTLGNEAFS